MNQELTITKKEVQKIAELARMKLSDGELEAAAGDLSNILDHFSQIQAIKTEGIPTADDLPASRQVSPGFTGVVRDDLAVPEEIAGHQELLEAAPKTHEGHIQVKAIFG